LAFDVFQRAPYRPFMFFFNQHVVGI
jgi:hypothetical protein